MMRDQTGSRVREGLRRVGLVAALVLGASLLAALPLTSEAGATTAPLRSTTHTRAGHSLATDTRFYTPPPAAGSIQQIAELLRTGQVASAGLLAEMELIPSAVWLDGETAAQAAEGTVGSVAADLDVARQVRQTLAAARWQRAVPIFVAYNIPSRDCSQYSAGGAPSDAAYDSWIDSISEAIGNANAVVIVEPDSLADLPGYCGSAYAAEFPGITDTSRIDDVHYAVTTLETDPNISVYLDAGNSDWQTTGNISEVLVAAGVQQAQGFVLNVSNYQYATNSVDYGIWVSSCIAYATVNEQVTESTALGYASTLDSADNSPAGAFSKCPNQYWNGGPANNYNGVAMSPYGVWSEAATTADLNTAGTDSAFASLLDGTVPTTHFVVDTSRDGQGPDSMESYSASPYDQPDSVVASLQSGNWCNPPGAGLGHQPTANTGGVADWLDSYLPADTPLVDAYLWIKTPGQSDGQCDVAGGVRAWDNSDGTIEATIAGWPSASSSTFSTFDPLWSIETSSVLTDPAAGDWFPEQALQLAQDASPPLSLPFGPGVRRGHQGG